MTTPTHPITEDDLVTLEQAIPALYQALSAEAKNNPTLRDYARMCQTILSRVRWDYGPYSEVQSIES